MPLLNSSGRLLSKGHRTGASGIAIGVKSFAVAHAPFRAGS